MFSSGFRRSKCGEASPLLRTLHDMGARDTRRFEEEMSAERGEISRDYTEIRGPIRHAVKARKSPHSQRGKEGQSSHQKSPQSRGDRVVKGSKTLGANTKPQQGGIDHQASIINRRRAAAKKYIFISAPPTLRPPIWRRRQHHPTPTSLCFSRSHGPILARAALLEG